MASGWVKSLHCKSRAFEDVHHPNPKQLMPGTSCRKSVQSIKDVIDSTKQKPKKKPKSSSPKRQPGSKYKAEPVSTPPNRSRLSDSAARPARAPDPSLPALMELHEGHPSRNVVEIIFHTSWSPKAFTGRIEMIFKVQNGSRTVSRFEEYRETVKSRAGSGGPTGGATWEENARCVADGNEVMRFHCLGPTSGGGVYDSRGGAWVFPGRKGRAICTFSGSGGAHESAGSGRGMRAMLVCRVIAGQVSKQQRVNDSVMDGRVGFDSVSGENGELLVLDSRAVLPCFLIIYKL
ncbi:uncharacterized protein LOC121236407 [Juglans microcarpa x Juglans regia]|uniref:uncharacterized protein LOC121236407 n=1 Tax=Juglans microcarpa x Juglans regia TaxID=2249226 RepID=UPI001B7E5556|nr:uncharacterized protein LOC121236407 [Juglans microcarpa x Juglans regia]